MPPIARKTRRQRPARAPAAELARLKLELAAAEARIAASDVIRRDSLLLRAYMDRSDLIAWLKDDRGRLVWANRNWFEAFGIDEAAALGCSDIELFAADDASRMRALDLEVLGGHQPQRGIERLHDTAGHDLSWQVTRFPFHDSRGERYVGGLAWDDTERVREHEEAHRQSITDPLTGLLNRRGFDALAGAELLRARRRGATCVLAFVDLDGLKSVNDRLGHAAGDAILVLAAMLLKKVFRTTDFVARLGGDEFAVLAPDSGDAVESIRRRLDAAVAELSASPILEAQLGFSIGLLACPPGGHESLGELLGQADGLMYADKQGKRG